MMTVNAYIICYSPWRVTDDCGGAFALGEIGGALFHAIKGAKNAAKVILTQSIALAHSTYVLSVSMFEHIF